jgi:hypothetical protein
VEDLTLAAVIATALFFDFTNGFHDTANAIRHERLDEGADAAHGRHPRGDPELRRVRLRRSRSRRPSPRGS